MFKLFEAKPELRERTSFWNEGGMMVNPALHRYQGFYKEMLTFFEIAAKLTTGFHFGLTRYLQPRLTTICLFSSASYTKIYKLEVAINLAWYGMVKAPYKGEWWRTGVQPRL